MVYDSCVNIRKLILIVVAALLLTGATLAKSNTIYSETNSYVCQDVTLSVDACPKELQVEFCSGVNLTVGIGCETITVRNERGFPIAYYSSENGSYSGNSFDLIFFVTDFIIWLCFVSLLYLLVKLIKKHAHTRH